MKTRWKTVLCLSSAALLSSCANVGGLDSSSSFTMNGFTYPSMDLHDPHFYMDDDRPVVPRWW